MRGSTFDYAAHIERIMARDAEALRRLYDHDASRLLGVALRILRRREAAEDVVHELFVRLWNDPPAFDPARSDGRAWLGTIVRNRAIDVARRDGQSRPLDAERHAALPDLAADPAAALARVQDAEALRRCLQELEPDRLACILLAYVDGLSQSEIAARRRMPIGTVKTWIRRGLVALRECLG